MMRDEETGHIFPLVLMLLTAGSLLLTPALNLSNTGLKSKQVQTDLLNEQYGRDAGAEYAMWQLIYGGAGSSLTDSSSEVNSTVTVNGVTATVLIKANATASLSGVKGAEDNTLIFVIRQDVFRKILEADQGLQERTMALIEARRAGKEKPPEKDGEKPAEAAEKPAQAADKKE